MHTKAMLACVIVGALGLAALRAQEQASNSTDEQFIRKSARDYCAAFNKGDVDAVLAYWAQDADYVDEDGETHRGKEAIGALFRESAENLKGHKLDLKVKSIRLVKPDVAIEDGIAMLTDPDGATSEGRYTAVWVKASDKWLINCARELPSDDEPASTSDTDDLQSLAWLVGEWVSEDDGPKVNLSSKWALDKRFLAQDYTVDGSDETQIRVTQWIGFDPASGQIKSWTFDSRGGYGEALWNREENSWHAEATGVLPDGRVGTALNTLRFVDDAHFDWRSTGRDVEGQPMPDAGVKFIRDGSTVKADAP